jgi:magnesium transporter
MTDSETPDRRRGGERRRESRGGRRSGLAGFDSLIPLYLLPDALNPVHQLRVMGRMIRRRATKPGTPPGTLVHGGERRVEKVLLEVIQFDSEGFEERTVESVAAIDFAESPRITWVNVVGLHDVDVVRQIGDKLGVHSLVLEDIVTTGDRPKVEDHKDYLFLVISILTFDREHGSVQEEQLSLLLGENWVVTFQERKSGSLEPVRERIRGGSSRIRSRGADYLAYALVDSVVDNYFSVLEALGDIVERVELDVLGSLHAHTMRSLHGLKREMMLVRRAVWPVREMVNNLIRTECRMVGDDTKVFLKDVYDHTVGIIDTVEVLRDLVGGTIDLYLSSLSQRQNEVMKVLTVMTSVFIPLTFLVGVYGMNFRFMPELNVPWAYPALLVSMGVIAGAMLWWFKRKGWL